MPPSTKELIRTRPSLLKRLQDWEDHAGWQDFFDTYSGVIYHLALRRGLDDGEAEDVVQETMIEVMKRMPGFNYDPALGSFKAWLFTIAKHRVVDQFRKRPRLRLHYRHREQTERGTQTEEMVADPNTLQMDALWDADWDNNLLRAAVAKVKRHQDPKKYQIYDLYVNKEMDAEIVARKMCVPVEHVYMAKHRIEEAIKAEVLRLDRQFN